MYQEVRATVTLTYSADATLTRAQLRKRILADVARLLDPDEDARDVLELVEAQLEALREEAQIYDVEGVTPRFATQPRAALCTTGMPAIGRRFTRRPAPGWLRVSSSSPTTPRRLPTTTSAAS